MLFYDPSTLKQKAQLVFDDFEKPTITPNRTDILLQLENVSVAHPGGHTLTNLSFTLNQGDNLVILGPEGSGKDLVADLITVSRKPEKGRVLFLNQNIHEKEDTDLETYRSCIAYISYNFGLINNLSVLENVILPLRYHTNLSEAKMIERANHFLERYHLFEKKDLRPQRINHNEALRAAFVRAIIGQPMLIFIDHAFASQCPLGLAKFLDLAEKDIAGNHISFIMTAFEYQQFHRYAHRYILLYEGMMVFSGTAAEIEKTTNPYVNQYIHDPLNGPMASFHR